MMAFRQQQTSEASQAFSLTQLICIGALLVVATTLHGCGAEDEKCPNGGVPIANGEVFFKCAGTNCTLDEAMALNGIYCDKGYGVGFKSTADKEMQFFVNKADECVIRFSHKPVACHKCNEGGVKCTDSDQPIVSSFKDEKKPVDPGFSEKEMKVVSEEGGNGNALQSFRDPDVPPGATDTEREAIEAAREAKNAATTEAETPAATTPAVENAAEEKKAAEVDNAASLLDIRGNDQGSKSVQIASADLDAKLKVTVSLADVDVHHDGSIAKSEPEATCIRRAGRKGFSHQNSRSSWALH